MPYICTVYSSFVKPNLYILKGRLENQLHLEPIVYRASFRRSMS